MAAGALTVAALVLLAGRLPGHAKLGGDLRPPDAQVYGMIDQRCEFRLGLLLYGLAPADQDHRPGAEPGNCASPAGHVPPPACAIGRVWALYRFLPCRTSKSPFMQTEQSGPLPAPVHDKDSARDPPLPGATGRRITMDEWLCRSVRRAEPDDRCCTVVPGADEVRTRRKRDKLTITDVCARSRHQPPDALRMAGEGPGAQGASRFSAAACVSAAPNISAGCLPVYSSSHDHRYTRSNLHVFLRQGGPISFRNRRRLSCRRILGMKRSHPTPRAGRSGLSSSWISFLLSQRSGGPRSPLL